jgi:hypothetical protein
MNQTDCCVRNDIADTPGRTLSENRPDAGGNEPYRTTPSSGELAVA